MCDMTHSWVTQLIHACLHEFALSWRGSWDDSWHIWHAILMCVWHELDSSVRVWEFTKHCNTCNTLQHTATHCSALSVRADFEMILDPFDMPHSCVWHELDPIDQNGNLQHTTTRYNTLQHTATHCNTLQHTATFCNTLQHTAVLHEFARILRWFFTHLTCLVHLRIHAWFICAWYESDSKRYSQDSLPHTAPHCNTLQHTATHSNTLQHTATHCNTLQHTAAMWESHSNKYERESLHHTAIHCNTLQHTATHCRHVRIWLQRVWMKLSHTCFNSYLDL